MIQFLLSIPSAIIQVHIIIAYKLVYDLWKWRRAIPVDHWHEWKNMAAASAIPASCFAFHSSWPPWVSVPLAGGMIAFYILVLFDGLYGVCRKFGFFYTGGKGTGQAKTGKILDQFPKWLQIVGKFVILALFIITYILSL